MKRKLPLLANMDILLLEVVGVFYRDKNCNATYLARKIGISRNHLNSICQASFGIPTSEFLARYRIHQALLAMQSTRRNKKFCCLDFGFSNERTYKRTLKKFLNTPEYKEHGVIEIWKPIIPFPPVKE
ncbi:MAG: helix-turn-helix domain-containing protein [Candidatus Kapaibacterium sp.]